MRGCQGALLLATPFARLQHSVANDTLLFKIAGLGAELPVPENTFELVLGAETADEIDELIVDYSPGAWRDGRDWRGCLTHPAEDHDGAQ
jgi:hypothetical protein